MEVSDAGEARRVLVVEDEEGLRLAYERILRGAGMAVVTCDSGEAALTRLRNGERFEVIVTDLVMSGMNGTDLLPLIRQFDGEVPIVIVTGQPSLRSSIAAVENGGFRYLLKPVASRELCKTVSAAAARHRLAALKLRALEVCENEGWRSAAGATLTEDFEAALGQLYMVYQPIVDASSALFGYEALVRTQSAAFRGPDQLFDAAERLGRVQELGRRIRFAVCQDIKDAPADSVLFVNLHASDLSDPELYGKESALAAHAARVVLEITERKSLNGSGDVRAKVGELRGLGYRIAVDDLGAGYAGLSCVNVLEPDIVKLDMSLVRDIDASSRKCSLVRSMLRVCQADLGMLVVCEGVETLAERETLVDVGATLLQGYLFARPQRSFADPATLVASSGYFAVGASAPIAVDG